MNKIFIILSLFLILNAQAVENIRIEKGVPVNSEHNKLLMQRYVVLPSGFEGQPVIVENSPEYKDLVDRNKSLSTQLEEEKKNQDIYKSSVDKLLIDKDKINKEIRQDLTKAETSKKKSWIVTWILGSLGFLIPVFVIILCVLNPALIPMIINFFVSLVHGIVIFASRIFTSLKITADKIASYKK